MYEIICVSVCLSVRLSVCSSACLSACPSVSVRGFVSMCVFAAFAYFSVSLRGMHVVFVDMCVYTYIPHTHIYIYIHVYIYIYSMDI